MKFRTSGRVVELSHVLEPGKEQYKLEIAMRQRDERQDEPKDIQHDICMWSHVGTHVEYALHFMPEGKDLSQLPLWRLMGPAIVLDFREKETNEPIELDDFQLAGDIQQGDIVITWTGRHNLYRTEASHDRPYVTHEAARWLAEDREIRSLGTDSSGFEVRGGPLDHPNHYLFFDREDPIPVIECMCNLDQLTNQRVDLISLPLMVKGLDAFPVRVIAIDPEA